MYACASWCKNDDTIGQEALGLLEKTLKNTHFHENEMINAVLIGLALSAVLLVPTFALLWFLTPSHQPHTAHSPDPANPHSHSHGPAGEVIPNAAAQTEQTPESQAPAEETPAAEKKDQ